MCFQQEKKEEKAPAKPAEEKKEEEPKPSEGVWLVSADWSSEDCFNSLVLGLKDLFKKKKGGGVNKKSEKRNGRWI